MCLKRKYMINEHWTLANQIFKQICLDRWWNPPVFACLRSCFLLYSTHLSAVNLEEKITPAHFASSPLFFSQFTLYTVCVSPCLPVHHFTHICSSYTRLYTNTQTVSRSHFLTLSLLLLFGILSLLLCVWLVLLWSMQSTVVLWFWAPVLQQSRTTSQSRHWTVVYVASETQRARQRQEWG